MVKVIGVNEDDMCFVLSVPLLLASSFDSAGERVLQRPIHKIVLIKEVEVRFTDKEIWYQYGLITLEDLVVTDS